MCVTLRLASNSSEKRYGKCWGTCTTNIYTQMKTHTGLLECSWEPPDTVLQYIGHHRTIEGTGLMPKLDSSHNIQTSIYKWQYLLNSLPWSPTHFSSVCAPWKRTGNTERFDSEYAWSQHQDGGWQSRGVRYGALKYNEGFYDTTGQKSLAPD